MQRDPDSSYDCAFLDDAVTDGRVAHGTSVREQYASDESPHAGRVPDAVVWPVSTDEVATVLAAANDRGYRLRHARAARVSRAMPFPRPAASSSARPRSMASKFRRATCR